MPNYCCSISTLFKIQFIGNNRPDSGDSRLAQSILTLSGTRLSSRKLDKTC